ncbi:hypothetical protein P7H32_07665 [Vagococcus lutrae]|nr:hypothetical protein [Vagococcus lutrae]
MEIMYLNELGYKVSVICGDITGELKKKLNESGINVSVISFTRVSEGKLGKISSYFYYRKYIKAAINENKYNNNILYWFGTADSAFANLGNLKHIKYVVKSLELYDETKYFLYRNLLKLVVRKSSAFVVCEINRAHIMKQWWNLEKLPYVISNKPYFHPTKRRAYSADMHEYINLLKDKKIILYQGAVPFGLNYIKKLARVLNKKDSDFFIVLLGNFSEDLFFELKNEYENIIKLDFIAAPNHLIITSYAHIGIAVYDECSLNNVYCAPNKIYEYAGFGIPVLGNKIPGLVNTIENNEFGKCIDFNSNEEIEEALNYIEKYYIKLSSKGKMFYKETNNKEIIEKVVRDIENEKKL